MNTPTLVATIGLTVLVGVGALLWILGGRPRTYHVSRLLAAPPAEVFPYLTDPDLLAEWIEGLVRTEPLTDGGPRLGARSRDTIEERGRRMEFLSEIVGWAPPERMDVQLEGPGVSATSGYRLEANEGGTHLTHEQTVRYRGMLRVMAPFIDGPVRAKLEGHLGRLQALTTP